MALRAKTASSTLSVRGGSSSRNTRTGLAYSRMYQSRDFNRWTGNVSLSKYLQHRQYRTGDARRRVDLADALDLLDQLVHAFDLEAAGNLSGDNRRPARCWPQSRRCSPARMLCGKQSNHLSYASSSTSASRQRSRNTARGGPPSATYAGTIQTRPSIGTKTCHWQRDHGLNDAGHRRHLDHLVVADSAAGEQGSQTAALFGKWSGRRRAAVEQVGCCRRQVLRPVLIYVHQQDALFVVGSQIAARFTAVTVLPTPPFKFTMLMLFMILSFLFSVVRGPFFRRTACFLAETAAF